MIHLPGLIQDLALILIVAGVVTILFQKLRQPVVLGYLIAGLLVGPHIGWMPTITDAPNLTVWAEIGVIFLLFALGLEFSFKKLAKVGGEASITAFVEVVGMVLIGFLTGRLFGWSTMDSLFLGGILAISSTTIIIRAFEEIGVKSRGYVSLVFGVLIVEDLFAILLMVLLSTVAISHQFAGGELLMSVGKLGFFLTLWFVAGIFLLPTALRHAKPYLNDETLIVLALGLCFLMVVFATKAGFSPALGAFIMGSLLAETTEAERIEHVITPVKNLFAAVFFVSVGMLINPSILFKNAVPVLIISGVTIIGKLLSTSLGALIAGRSLRHSVQSGFSLAQIGEFSFIIASLGQTLKVTSEFLYPVAVGVSVVTTFATPYLIRAADPAYDVLEKHMPASWKAALSRYSTSLQGAARTSEWGDLIRSYLLKTVINSVVITALFLVLARTLPPALEDWTQNQRIAHGIGLMIAIFLSAPFFWALAMSRPRKIQLGELWRDKRYRVPIASLEAARWLAALALFGVLSTQFVSLALALGLSLGLSVLLLVGFARYLETAYRWFEARFMQNLSERERERAVAETPTPALAPWDAHITRLDVPPESPFVGLTLEELKIRERFGVTIALIERGRRQITAPTRYERLYPGDRISLIGTDEQLAHFRQGMSSDVAIEDREKIRAANYSLQPIHIGEDSRFRSKTIRDSGLREQTKGLVIGLERSGERILNPDSSIKIEEGDVLWIVGAEELIRQI